MNGKLMEQAAILNHSSRIGLLADSHGNLRSIRKGIDRLKKSRVQVLVHLGDIFDSLENDNLHEIIAIIRRNNFLTVKGNNDYQVENLLVNGHTFDIPLVKRDNVLSYLRNMPMRLVDQNVCYAHSLPFNSIRSFYEPVDTGSTQRAGRLFEETPYKCIFCGHSHSSVLFRWSSGVVTRELIDPGKKIYFKDAERYIIIVGSADSGECGIFDKGRMTYRRAGIDL